jgi:hypothetical protein
MTALISLLAALATAQAAAAVPAERIERLTGACSLVHQIHATLMLTVMAEGPLDCGNPDEGVVVDCAANETPDERAAHARRLAVREVQEAAFKRASEACEAWEADRASVPLYNAAVRAFNEARAHDIGQVPR